MKQYPFLRGRLARAAYAIRLAPTLTLLLPAYYLPAPQAWPQVALAGLVLAVSTALGALLAVRRLHDLHLSGWYALALLVPIINLPGYVLLLVLPGTPGFNPWGPPTSAKSVLVPVRR